MSWVSSPAFCHHSSKAAAVIVTKTIQVRLPNPLFCFLNTHEWGPAAEWTGYNQHFQGCRSNTSNSYDIDFLVDSRTGLMWSQEQPHGWSGELRCSTISPQALAHWWINNNHRGLRTLDICTVFTHMTVKNNQLWGVVVGVVVRGDTFRWWKLDLRIVLHTSSEQLQWLRGQRGVCCATWGRVNWSMLTLKQNTRQLSRRPVPTVCGNYRGSFNQAKSVTTICAQLLPIYHIFCRTLVIIKNLFFNHYLSILDN